ncbi:hypothetical protein [Thaumasiovibrio sp. DFM-14]|uniref:hypothetical protein n=1 Tax=Thaumasiovibrio sp. DFM-14 TaxID=3384792 RepID=UPI0039A2D871
MSILTPDRVARIAAFTVGFCQVPVLMFIAAMTASSFLFDGPRFGVRVPQESIFLTLFYMWWGYGVALIRDSGALAV